MLGGGSTHLLFQHLGDRGRRPWLHSKSDGSLGYTGPCHNKQTTIANKHTGEFHSNRMRGEKKGRGSFPGVFVPALAAGHHQLQTAEQAAG